MCGLFSDGKMQYAPSTAVNSSEGAVTVRPHPEKWWAQWWMSESWSWRPDFCLCALCSLWSFGHQLKGDALSILALNAFPNLAPRKRRKQPRPPVRQTHKTSREEGAVGRQQLTSSPRGSQPLPRNPGLRTDASEGARSLCRLRADPVGWAGAAPPHSSTRSQTA